MGNKCEIRESYYARVFMMMSASTENSNRNQSRSGWVLRDAETKHLRFGTTCPCLFISSTLCIGCARLISSHGLFESSSLIVVSPIILIPDQQRPEEDLGADHDDERVKATRTYSYRDGGHVLLLLRVTRDELLCGKSRLAIPFN